MRRLLVALGVVLALGASELRAQSEQVLVLQDGRRFTVSRLERRGDRIRFQTTQGQVFEIGADQVAEPPLESIPEAGAQPPPAPPAAAAAAPVAAQTGPQILVLTDGRRVEVVRLERQGDRVRFRTVRGEDFEVPASQVAEPPLESIPLAGQAPAPPVPGVDEVREQTLVLRDGRRIDVIRLARRGGQVIFQTVRGEGFSVPESEVVEPPLETIPSLDAPTAAPGPPTPPAPPTPEPDAKPVLPEMEVVERVAGPDVPDFVAIPDRWTIEYPPYPGRNVPAGGPYDRSKLKGDWPVIGEDVFLVLNATLDVPNELRRIPIPSGVTTENPDNSEFFGDGDQFFTTPRLFAGFELFKGQTAFKPKTWSIKVTGAYNLNYLETQERNIVNIDPRKGITRTTDHASLEEAYAEVKLADLSPYYDSVSLRTGIQYYVTDFRGFIFNDFNLGARLFGNLSENRWQYNLAYFDLLEKETNSELNTFEKREQRVYVANLFRQDFLTRGYTLSLSYHRSEDEASEKKHYDTNDFQVRPARIGSQRLHDVIANYVGFAGDGHIGRYNITHAYYYAFGEDEDNPLADHAVDIKAHMAALELSVDKDWIRFRTSAFFASGDSDPFDETGAGFDNIYDFANFAGGPFSFWNRSAIPLTQTSVFLKGINSLVPNLRSNKFEGQANYVNPGVMLLNGSVDLDLTPKLKATLNANWIRFHHTEPLEELLFQPNIDSGVGIDLGAGVLWRPDLNENIQILAGVTGLIPTAGFKDLYSSTCSVAGCGADQSGMFNAFVQLKLIY